MPVRDEIDREPVALAHDLAKPVGAIAYLASQLSLHTRDDERVRRDARRIAAISQDLLDVLRAVMSGGPGGGPSVDGSGDAGDESFCAEDAVSAAVRAVRLRHPSRKVQVRVGAGLPRIAGRVVVVRRVVENLLENALAASPPGRGVVVRVQAEEEGVRIDVADTGRRPEGGTGAPRPRPRAAPPGHGIGLPASRRAVEAMGGSLTLLRREGGGTVARVTLPAAEAGTQGEWCG